MYLLNSDSSVKKNRTLKFIKQTKKNPLQPEKGHTNNKCKNHLIMRV